MKAKTNKSQQSGQAIIEYVILLTIIFGLGGLMVGSIRITRDKMWKKMLCEVSAACPDCKATDSARSALPKAGVQCKN